MRFGYTLSSEEFAPNDLVRQAVRAEEAGFAFCSISDHLHPWVSEQGHSPFVWAVLGAVAEATSSIEVGVGVTCPILRIHPLLVAHASATVSRLFAGRFFLGVGTGENLNEHAVGVRWPAPEVRLEMLDEAIAVIRMLWTGDTIDHRGTYYELENARLFDPPEREPEIIVSGFGKKAVQLAARVGDGYWGHAPDADTIRTYRDNGGTGRRIAQIHVCVGRDREACRATVLRQWPNAGVPGQLSQDLPTWTHFEQAAQLVTVDIATERVPCGPDAGAVIETAQSYLDAGYDHVYFHQIGPDQDAFFTMWEHELRKALVSR